LLIVIIKKGEKFKIEAISKLPRYYQIKLDISLNKNIELLLNIVKPKKKKYFKVFIIKILL